MSANFGRLGFRPDGRNCWPALLSAGGRADQTAADCGNTVNHRLIPEFIRWSITQTEPDKLAVSLEEGDHKYI